MRYSLRQLEVFAAVARTESVSRAARELSMSQSAASGALSELEAQFDVRLFDRVGKRLRLNGLGRSVRARAEAVLSGAEALDRALSGRDEPAPLRVGATLTIGEYLAIPLVARFRREHPGAKITLDIANTRETARKVQNFEIDVGLVEGELQDEELEVTPWREDELVMFSAPADPLARKKVLTDEDLLSVPFIVREPGSGTRQAFERALAGLLPRLHLSLELQQTQAIKGAVLAGLGVGCVSKLALADELRRGTFRALRVRGRDFRRRLFTVVHRKKFRSAGVEQWLGLCQDAARADGEGPRRPRDR